MYQVLLSQLPCIVVDCFFLDVLAPSADNISKHRNVSLNVLQDDTKHLSMVQYPFVIVFASSRMKNMQDKICDASNNAGTRQMIFHGRWKPFVLSESQSNSFADARSS